MKYLDNNGLLYFWTKIKTYLSTELSKKVNVEPGKGLSTNDLTEELKQKILNAGTSNFDGAYSTLTGKPQINNVELSGNLTLTQLGIQPKGDYPTQANVTSQISQAVGKITQFKTEVVSTLPSSGEAGKIYLVKSLTSGDKQTYDEYMWINGAWEFIGTTAPDLTQYVKAKDLSAITNGEIDPIFS